MSEEQVAGVPEEGVTQSVAAEDWRGMIPEDIRGHRSLSHISDIGALAKSYVHAQSMIGADKVVVPGKHATPEEWSDFYAKTGRPEAPDGYEIATPENGNQEMTDWFSQTAHDLGLNTRQAQELFNRYNDFADSMNSQGTIDREAFVAQTEQDLRAEYGEAFEDRLENGRAVVEEFANPEIMEMQMSDGTMLGDHPDFIRMVAQIGEFISSRLGEDQLEGMKVSNAMTPDDAKRELEEIMADGSPYHKANHPSHDDYVKRALALNELIYG